MVYLVSELVKFMRNQEEKNEENIKQIRDKVRNSIKELRKAFENSGYRGQIHAISMIRRSLF